MGGADEPPLDRIHSWARASASDRNDLSRQQSGRTLPTSNSTTLPGSDHGDAPLPAQSRTTSSSGYFDTHHAEKPAHALDHVAPVNARPSPPFGHDTQARDASSALERARGKPPWSLRAKNGCIRFANHTKNALLHSWVNVLLIFVPVGIAMNWVPLPGTTKPTVVFALNAVAIVPLAGLLSHATESVASRMGDTWASLLNVTFGNAVELIIFIIALSKNEIRIVQASILGSILANLLLILGMAFVLGGLRFREQIYNSTVTQMSACLLSLSVTSLLLPTAFHASFSDSSTADSQTTKISRGTSVVLLIVYGLYLAFQLKSHAYMYESTPQNVIDEESHPGVLAEFMNSSSDSSSSSSDSDSDSSSGSNRTAKRIKRVLRSGRRRKSSGSSAVTAASPATSQSPHDKPNISAGESLPPPANLRDIGHVRAQQELGTAVFSGDEADTDGERGTIHGSSRFHDFVDTGDSAKSGPVSPLDENKEVSAKSRKKSRKQRRQEKREEKRERKQRKKAKKQQREAMQLQEEMPTVEQTTPSQPRVEFADQRTAEATTTTSTARRPFAMSRPSFRPAMPKMFSNTVFSTPAPPPINATQPLARLALASRGTSYRGSRSNGLRRTSSLPDRLRERNQTPRGEGQAPHASQRGGTLAINEADALRKDKKSDEDGDDGDEQPVMSRTAAVVLLLVTTGLVAFCAELLVDAIPAMISNSDVSQAFIGLIILPIVGNAAEHVTAVTVATKNKMDLAIGVAVGSSIQIALFVTPLIVILGWIMNKEMSLYFNLFETVSLFVTAFVVNFLVLDGRSNYLEGALLMAAYVIIAVCSYFYPNEGAQSELGGNIGGG